MLCHAALEKGTLGTWVEAKCHATLMHEHGSGKVRGMENTWPFVKLVWGWCPTPNPNSMVVEEEEKNLFGGIEKRGRKERKKEKKIRKKEEKKGKKKRRKERRRLPPLQEVGFLSYLCLGSFNGPRA